MSFHFSVANTRTFETISSQDFLRLRGAVALILMLLTPVWSTTYGIQTIPRKTLKAQNQDKSVLAAESGPKRITKH